MLALIKSFSFSFRIFLLTKIVLPFEFLFLFFFKERNEKKVGRALNTVRQVVEGADQL